jgi:hypothetical protein
MSADWADKARKNVTDRSTYDNGSDAPEPFFFLLPEVSGFARAVTGVGRESAVA